MVIGAFLSLLWVNPLLQQPDIPWDGMGVAIFFVSALIELTAEPLWVMAQSCQYVTIKVSSNIAITSTVYRFILDLEIVSELIQNMCIGREKISVLGHMLLML